MKLGIEQLIDPTEDLRVLRLVDYDAERVLCERKVTRRELIVGSLSDWRGANALIDASEACKGEKGLEVRSQALFCEAAELLFGDECRGYLPIILGTCEEVAEEPRQLCAST